MHPNYPELCRDLKVVSAFEKVASQVEEEFAPEAAEKLALACNEVFESVLTRSGASGRYEVKSAQVIDFVLTLRDSHVEVGEKVATDTTLVSESIMKLATAVYLDDVISQTLPTLQGEAKEAALTTRLLGREYAVTLMRNLLS